MGRTIALSDSEALAYRIEQVLAGRRKNRATNHGRPWAPKPATVITPAHVNALTEQTRAVAT
jgi:hypothetical protein